MAKKEKWHNLNEFLDDPRTHKAILPLFIVIGATVAVFTLWSVMNTPKAAPGTRSGVGADGFQAFVEEKSDLGVKTITSNTQVKTALGSKVKSVSDGESSQVFNLNGDRSQSLTFSFVRSDGMKANIYVDMKLYKSSQSLESDHIYTATATAGAIQGFPAYYKHAQTIDSFREYHLLVVNGLKAYRFVFAQPSDKITVSEIDAVAVLKKIAQNSQL